MIFEVASVNAIVTAVALSTLEEKHARAAGLYAIINFTAYFAVSLTGAFLPSWFLVSFELMTLFCIPGFIAAFVFNVRAYRRNRDAMNRNLIFTWVSLFLIMAAYYGYLLAGFTEKLWADGIWFSANDVLHVGLILWMLYIAFSVAGKVMDRRADNSSV
ncbi:MAG TPA: hypothetical protein ENN21_10245 [Spirochaetes bacterium]|nr:hypothetical protein [Spirochaetota bacterium]